MGDKERSDNANKQFVCEYEFDGTRWGVELWASTHEEAEMKLRAMSKGSVLGILKETIPANGRCPTCGNSFDPPEQEA